LGSELSVDHNLVVITIWQLSELGLQGSIALRNAESDSILEDFIIKVDDDIILRVLTISIHNLGLPRSNLIGNGLVSVASLVTKHKLENWIDLGVFNGEGFSLSHLDPLVLLHHEDLGRSEVNRALRDRLLTHWALHWLSIQ